MSLAVKEYAKARKPGDFTQFGESEVIQGLVPSLGVYLDIGSGRPVSGSNTFGLYKLGWRGILADPLRANIVSSKLVRKRDIAIQCIVGSEATSTFFEMHPYEYSTLSVEIVDSLISGKKAIMLQAYKVKGLLASTLYNMLPSHSFSFVNIDAEGFDFEVLLSLDLKKNKPNLICIEEWDHSSHQKSRIRDLLELHEYRFVARTGVSNFYSR